MSVDKALKHIREPFHEIEELTDRQREALNLACRGIRGKQMAEELGLGLRAAIALTNRAVAIINEAEDWDIKPKSLPDILLKLVEEELSESPLPKTNDVLENLDPYYQSATERLNRFFSVEKESLYKLSREELLWYLATVLLWVDLINDDEDTEEE